MNRRYGHKRAMREAEENLDVYRRFVSDAEMERLWNERGAEDIDADEDEINEEWFGEEER